MLLIILILLLLYYFISEYNYPYEHSDINLYNSGFVNKHLTSYKDDNEFYIDKSLFMPLIDENLLEKRKGSGVVLYGNYGDVPVGLYKKEDLKTSNQWTRSDAVYVPDTRYL